MNRGHYEYKSIIITLNIMICVRNWFFFY